MAYTNTFLKLNPIEKDFVLNWFLYFMSMEQREKLMTEHPTIYNKLCDQEVMVSIRKIDLQERLGAK